MVKISPSCKNSFVVIAGVLTSYLAYNYYRYEKSPVVEISNGKIQGFVSWSRGGRRFYQFLGIPYAKPPLGSLRFEPPEPPENWNDTLDATKYGSTCPGYDFLVNDRRQGDEDCLFLNVMTPNLNPKDKRTLYPVIMYVHGGSFQTGSASLYKGKYFMDENVLLVTINYRLGIFGFLSTTDDVIKGNMGLKDQVMALRWIQENIKYFGGDPKQVTIMGESAGGTSVHYLMLSPLAKKLFHRAISMSCDSFFEVFQPHYRNLSRQLELLSNYFHCPLSSTKDFAQCMKKKSTDSLLELRIKKTSLSYFDNMAEFGPAKEIDHPEAFLTELPLPLLQQQKLASPVPWMMGFNQNEGLMLVGKLLQFPSKYHLTQDDQLWDKIIPNILFYDAQAHPDAARTIKRHFFKNSSAELSHWKTIKTLSNLISEKLFIRSMMETAKLQSSIAPVYSYTYTHKSFLSSFNFLKWASAESSVPTHLLIFCKFMEDIVVKFVFGGRKFDYGVSHGDELPLLFDVTPVTDFFTYFWEYKMSKLLVKTIADYTYIWKKVKFNQRDWPANNPLEPLKFMELKIGPPALLERVFTEQLRFWTKLNLTRV